MKIITGNLGKYAPFKEELQSLGLELVISKLEIPEFQGNDFDKVVEAKAKYVHDYYKESYLVDDLGLFLETYPNFPGVCTKFVLSNLGKEGLSQLLKGKSHKATLKCKIGYWSADKLYAVEGIVEGILDFNKEVNSDDPGPLSSWFIPIETTCKGSLEHRYRAILKLKDILEFKKGE